MNQRDLSISMKDAATKSLVIAGPIALVQVVAYFVIHKFLHIPANVSMFWFAFFLLAGIFIHELIHLLSWKIFTRFPWSTFKIGFQWKVLTPYAHCNQPMDIFPYRIGSAAPGLLLGIVPWLISLFNGNVLLFFYGLAFTTAAGGDFLILWMLRTVKPHTLVEDHPSNAGCYIYENQ